MNEWNQFQVFASVYFSKEQSVLISFKEHEEIKIFLVSQYNSTKPLTFIQNYFILRHRLWKKAIEQWEKDFSCFCPILIGSDVETRRKKVPKSNPDVFVRMTWFDIDIPVLVLLSDHIEGLVVHEHKHLDSASFERHVPFLLVETKWRLYDFVVSFVCLHCHSNPNLDRLRLMTNHHYWYYDVEDTIFYLNPCITNLKLKWEYFHDLATIRFVQVIDRRSRFETSFFSCLRNERKWNQ